MTQRSKKKEMPQKKYVFWLYFFPILLSLVGLLFVFEASSVRSFTEFSDSFHYLKLQFAWIVLGICIMTFFALIDYHKLYYLAFIFMMTSIVLLCMVLIPGLGHKAGGARRWIDFGLINVQPTELAKFSVVIYLSSWFIYKERKRFFSFIILLGTFLQIFLAESLYQVIIRCLIFIAMFLSMGLLAKMVDREVRSKEELQVLSQELAEANQELKRLDAAKSEFISIASHQLRTPLTAIRGYISLVLEGSYGKVTPTLQDVLNKVYVVNNRMGQLVEDLLSISRIESGRVQYNLVATQLEPMVADLVDMFSIMAKSKGLALKMKLPKKSLPKLMIDATKMREVISNLIDNALKYTKEGGVTVTVDGDDRYVAVRVQDTGIGVDPQDSKRLFEKFTRSSETMKLDVSGTGLGLYVGKNFVEAHGGLLSVESEGPGKGSTFIIKLPVEPPRPKSVTS
jgi:cell division protein FtsW